MSQQEINNTSVTIFASVVAGLGLLAWLKVPDNFKSVSATIFFSGVSMAICSKVTSEQNNRDLQYILKGCFEKESQLSQDIERLGEANAALLETNTLQSTTIENYQLQLDKNAETIRHFDFILAKARENEQTAKRMLFEHQSALDNRFTHFVDEHLRKSLATLDDCVERAYTALVDKVDSYLAKSNYESIHQELDAYKDRLVQCYENHISMIDNHTELDPIEISSVADAIKKSENVTKLSVQILEEISALRVKFRNVLNVDERRTLQELSECQPYLVKKSTAIESVREQASHDQSIIDRLEALVNDQSSAIDSDLKDAVQQIEKLNERVAELSKPQNWKFALSHELKAGNILIEFFNQQRIILDRSHYMGDKYEVDLYFHTDRNKRVIVPKELNEYSDQLMQVCRTLEPVTFKYDSEAGLMVAHLVMAKRPKKESTSSDIDKIWIPSTKFESYVRHWERVRITAGSTGGKSPTAKNLALCVMKSRLFNGEIRLYDPQHGSKKDFWNMPKHGTSHEDNVTGMEQLVDELNRRTKSPSEHPFILYIFDEVDSTIAQERNNNDYYHFRDLITYTLKQASHQNLGAIFIGQAADANTIPGMSWSDWNNAVQLHIGSNAGIWLDKAKTITTEDKTRLLEQYRKIQEYCDKQNEELGLDIFSDAGAYRFALAVPLTGLPKFIQLPDFDTYDYNEVMILNTQNQVFSEVSTSADMSSLAKDLQSIVKCPDCETVNPKSKGNRWQCINPECGRTWLKNPKK